jgi:L-2-hydroxycarboxylate dehydrogenase (NAD+)
VEHPAVASGIDGAGNPGAGEAAVLVPPAVLARFISRVLEQLGVRPADARVAADVLVLADRRGITSHGVGRLDQYARALRTGIVTPRPNVRVERRHRAVELWDGDHGLGHPTSRRAMARAIVLARRYGIGSVAVRESSHFGIAGAYVKQAIDAGVIGVALTNADPLVAPTGSRVRALGTNPIAFGAPSARGTDFLLDMATSVVTGGRLEVARRVGEQMPLGWALDDQGEPTTDPWAAEQGSLLPLGGGGTASGGHKGYGLAAAVGILTGVLPDSGSVFDVRSLYASSGTARVGHWFLALDPSVFGPLAAFGARLDAFTDTLKALPSETTGGEVLVAGEPETRMEAARSDWLPLHPVVFAMLGSVASEVSAGWVWTSLRKAARHCIVDAAPDDRNVGAGHRAEVRGG